MRAARSASAFEAARCILPVSGAWGDMRRHPQKHQPHKKRNRSGAYAMNLDCGGMRDTL
jgi:hypothetical protein